MKQHRYATGTSVTGVSVLTPYAGAYRNYAEVGVTGVTPTAFAKLKPTSEEFVSS